MIDEKKLEALRELLRCEGDRFDFVGRPFTDMLDTLEALWKVARAADDAIGTMGANASSDLREALAALHERSGKGSV